VLESSHSSTHHFKSSCNDEVHEDQIDALLYVKAPHGVIAVDRKALAIDDQASEGVD
jgi:hypothetical protein